MSLVVNGFGGIIVDSAIKSPIQIELECHELFFLESIKFLKHVML